MPRANVDIRAITQRRDGNTLIHTIETYGRWDSSDFGPKGIGIYLGFWTGLGEQPDRTLVLWDDGGELRATLVARHHRSWDVPVTRRDRRSAQVRIPRHLIEGEKHRRTYEWRAFINQAYAVPIACEPAPTPSASAVSSSSTPSPSATPDAGGSPTPSPAASICAHGDVFSFDRAPDRGRLTEYLRRPDA